MSKIRKSVKMKQRNKIMQLIYILAHTVILFLFICFFIYISKIDREISIADKNLNEIDNYVKTNEKNKDNKEKNNIDLEYYKKFYNNEDIIARLEIPNLFNILIVKGKDNNYYLNHSISKEKDVKGTEFMDYRVDFNSKQINIYGHNSLDYDTPFRKIEQFQNQDFFNNNSLIYLEDSASFRQYKIICFKEIKEDLEHMKVDISKESFKDHIDSLKDNSIFSKEFAYDNSSNIIVLQTCSYNQIDSYFLLIGIEIT